LRCYLLQQKSLPPIDVEEEDDKDNDDYRDKGDDADDDIAMESDAEAD